MTKISVPLSPVLSESLLPPPFHIKTIRDKIETLATALKQFDHEKIYMRLKLQERWSQLLNEVRTFFEQNPE